MIHESKDGLAGNGCADSGTQAAQHMGLHQTALAALPAVVGVITPFMPWLLAFAAGAMFYVVVEELIPAAHLDSHSDSGTLAVLAGFIVMMVLDTALS